MCGDGESEEGAEGDADEGNAVRVHAGAGGDMGEGGADGVEPAGDVSAGGREEVGGGAGCAGGVEIVDGEDGDAKGGDVRGDAVEPEADVAASAVEEEDGGVRTGSGGLMDVKAEGAGTVGEAGLHALGVMRVWVSGAGYDLA